VKVVMLGVTKAILVALLIILVLHCLVHCTCEGGDAGSNKGNICGPVFLIKNGEFVVMSVTVELGGDGALEPKL
jgi:hypothetical protein